MKEELGVKVYSILIGTAIVMVSGSFQNYTKAGASYFGYLFPWLKRLSSATIPEIIWPGLLIDLFLWSVSVYVILKMITYEA